MSPPRLDDEDKDQQQRQQPADQHHDPSPSSCVWLGVDFGTTHSCTAIWDSSRGRPKWMRLGALAYVESSCNKMGRIVPSCVLLATTRVNEHFTNVSDLLLHASGRKKEPAELYACVGAPALTLLDESRSMSSSLTASSSLASKSTSASIPFSEQQVSDALITSLKRQVLSSPLTDSSSKSPDRAITCIPLGCSEPLQLDATQLMAVVLTAIRAASLAYLSSRQARLKKLQPPKSSAGNCATCRQETLTLQEPIASSSSSSCSTASNINCHVVIGIPAQCQSLHGQGYRQVLEQAASLAGFASVNCIVESTAAAMAYGITLSPNSNDSKTTIMVLDMGGGTTDVTIAMNTSKEDEGDDDDDDDEKDSSDEGWQVKVTEGTALGGDDLDQLLVDHVIHILESTLAGDVSLSDCQTHDLRRQCRLIKEELCGNSDKDSRRPPKSSYVIVQGQRIPITQENLQIILTPWLQQAEQIVRNAVKRFGSADMIDEVILVGGSSRVPAIRTMLQSLFPTIELCLSVNPMSAVAQGAAIQAAIESALVPLHELKSAMMLDTLPYAIGILAANDNFVEILSQGATLPARGSAVFQLATARQFGISFQVVEYIDNDDAPDSSSGATATQYQPIREFTFLLHRLSASQIKKLQGERSVEVGMIMRESGELVVSLFDPNDPEHVAKRALVEGSADVATCPSIMKETLGYNSADTEGLATDQILLIVLCGIVLVLYVAVKVLFTDERVTEMVNQRQTT